MVHARATLLIREACVARNAVAIRSTAHTHRWHTHGLVLGSSSGDSHGTRTAIEALHLSQGPLHFAFIAETNETVASGGVGNRISHDLGRLAGRVSRLEKLMQSKLSHIGSKVTDENRELRATVVTLVQETTTRSPIKFEDSLGVRDGLTIEGDGFRSSSGVGKLYKAVARVGTRKLVADELDANVLTINGPDLLDGILVKPGLELTHPKSVLYIRIRRISTVDKDGRGSRRATRRGGRGTSVERSGISGSRGGSRGISLSTFLHRIVVGVRHDFLINL